MWMKGLAASSRRVRQLTFNDASDTMLHAAIMVLLDTGTDCRATLQQMCAQHRDKSTFTAVAHHH